MKLSFNETQEESEENSEDSENSEDLKEPEVAKFVSHMVRIWSEVNGKKLEVGDILGRR